MSEHGHGPETHEAHGESKWQKGILSVLKGAGLTLGALVIASTILTATPLVIPAYMKYMTYKMAPGIIPGIVGGVIGAKLAGTGKAESGKAAKKDSHGH
jgi:hypothetical protein